MTFRAVVHPETVIGSDANFGGTQSINNNNNNPLTNCTVRPLEQTIIAPVSSTISRNSELQHYDLVANAIANSDEYKEYLKKEHQHLLRADAFKAIVLLSDVRQQQLSSSSRTGVPPTSKSASTTSTSSNHVWEGRVLDERIHAGERYFLPSAVHTNIITFYHHGIRDCQQLYAGRVVAVFGSIMTRDSTTNAIVSVALNHIITAPSIGYGLNPNASLLASNTKDGKELVAAMIKRNNNSSTTTPTTGIQRIHFCPIPSHFEDENKLLEDFLRDTILYLTEDRSSSLVVFVGALVGRTKSAAASNSNASTSSSGGVAAVQRTNIAQKMRVILTEAVQKNQRAHVPLMFVPGVDDLSLRPSVVPQSNLFLPNGERIAPNVHLPSNPAVFYTDKDDSTGLTIVATSVDIQNALLVHSVSKENNKLMNDAGGEQHQQHPRPPKLSVCADTLLRSGLCVPYLQDTQYEEDLYVIEPSSLPELTVTPHIHFSPTSVVSSPQAFIHGNGTLFVSCNVGSSVSFAQGGRCTVMEVDVAPGKLGGASATSSPFLMNKESVRVRAIDFIRNK